jgi:thiamine-monophosphate kinase
LASVALHPDDAVADVLDLLAKLHTTGAAYGAPLVGGDISRTTGPWVIAVTALGEVKPKQALRRHRGLAGDCICVTGPLGAAAAGLVQLQGGGARTQSLVRRQLRPTPRVALGRALAAAGCVRAAADISDGLVKDAVHLAAPACGVQLDVAAVPVARGVAAVAHAARLSAWQMALSGGEDFELVLAVAPRVLQRAQACAEAHGTRLHVVGRIVATPGLQLVGAPQAATLHGFDHFG